MQKESLIISICLGVLAFTALTLVYCPELYGIDEKSKKDTTISEEVTEPTDNALNNNQFAEVSYQFADNGLEQRVIYDKISKVMYLICETDKGMDITPMYNADGTLRTYQEDTTEVPTESTKAITTSDNTEPTSRRDVIIIN